MTALHTVAPAQRTGDQPTPSVGTSRTVEALELLRAAEALGGDAGRPCAGSSTCGRPGSLTVVTAEGTTELCGLHAMTVVFSTASGPLVVVKPEH